MSEHFADRLMAAIKEKGSRICVGIDPVVERLPCTIGDEGDRIGQVRAFCTGILRAVADHCAVAKPNSAFFEALGPQGMGLLHDVIGEAKRLGLLVILDAKRNDIGSTAEAYAKAIFGGGGAVPDAVTVNPYLGSDGVQPFIEAAEACGGGIFVLVKTSNPSSAQLQDLKVDGKPVYHHVAELVDDWGSAHVGESGWSSVGAVVGATWPEQLVELREAMPRTPFLVPGYGAQGGGAGDVLAAFDEEGLGAVVNSSRGIIYAIDREPHADRFAPDEWERAAAAAAEEMRDTINEAIDGR
ncbi:MAG: orotidine-5'-phosphate decarboxylase [Armatimonadota bacterium]